MAIALAAHMMMKNFLVWQKALAILSLLTMEEHPSRPKCNSLSSVPSRLKCNLSPTRPLAHLWAGQFQIEHRSACNGRKTLQNPGSLKGWLGAVNLKSRSGSGSRWFLLFGMGIL
jgi:hypothetical protein